MPFMQANSVEDQHGALKSPPTTVQMIVWFEVPRHVLCQTLDSGLKYSQEYIVLARVQLRILIGISIAPDQMGGRTL